MASTWILYEGIKIIEEATVTFSTGTVPSSSVFQIVPQPFNTIPIVGDIEIVYENKPVVRVSQCRVQQGKTEIDQSGITSTITVLDRRWKWGRAFANGSYNLITASGEPYRPKVPDAEPPNFANTQRHLRDILSDLLELAGENSGDWFINVPDAFPQMIFDLEPVDRALATIAEQFGLVIAPHPESGGRIEPAFAGPGIQDGPVEFDEVSLNPRLLPKSVKVVSAPAVISATLPLEPVGLDLTEKQTLIRPLDQLSYKTAINVAHPGTFSEAIDDADLKSLAESSLWRLYRIADVTDRTGAAFREQLYPWFRCREQLTLTARVQTGKDNDERAWQVGGVFDSPIPMAQRSVFTAQQIRSRSLDFANAFIDPDSPNSIGFIPHGWSVDRDNYVVSFSTPAYKRGAAHEALFADLFLYCSFTLRQFTGHPPLAPGEIWRVEVEEEVNPDGFGVDLYPCPWIVPEWSVESNNFDTVREQLSEVMRAIAVTYNSHAGQSRRYSGLLALQLSGNISSITWSFGRGGAVTQASTYASASQGMTSRQRSLIMSALSTQQQDRAKSTLGAKTV